MISDCLERGWNSVLFDASTLPVEENLRQTIEVVAEARRYGAHVEGEIEGIQGVEDGIGSDEASARQSLEVAVDFIEQHRGRLLRPGDRQRPRRLPGRARRSTRSGSPTSWPPPASRWRCTAAPG